MQPVLDAKKATFKLFIKNTIVTVVTGFLILVTVSLVLFYRSFGITPSTIANIIRNDFSTLKNTESRTNVLLLGIGGGSHEGTDLTDTIMVISIDPVKKDTLFVSIPRDLWIPEQKDKINSVYSYAEKKSTWSGTESIKSVVSTIIGQPIHYALLLDFSGFVQIIDLVGGIEVDVTHGFSDPLYPIAGKETDECGGDPTFACRYETVTFTQGTELMNGARALKYVRSRHAQGDDGTDFSRSTRQQEVLSGLKAKLLRQEVVTNLRFIQTLFNQARNSLKGDMTESELALFVRAYSLITTPSRSANLTQDQKDSPGLLINPPPVKYQGKWVLIPKQEGYSQIQKYIDCQIHNQSTCENFLN